MIDINSLRNNPEFYKKATADKQFDPKIVDEAIKLDEEWRKTLQKVEELRSQRNVLSKNPNKEDIQKARKLKEELKESEEKLKEIEEKRENAIKLIPNPPAPEVPVGKNEDENVELRKWGDVPKFDFEPKDHVEIGKDLGLIDFEAGAKVSGSQFYYLRGDAVLLELGLLQFGVEFLSKKGYQPFVTPDLAKSRFYLGTGYQPKGDEAQIYEIEGEDLGLIATAEVTMAGLHSDEVLNKKDFPLRYAAISHCFRKEAGAYGKYSRGLYRVHQFTKLEMFIYSTPDKSEEMHQELLGIEEEIIQALKIPYRVLEMCTGDLGAMASKKYDLEAWMPGRGDYGEITSTSNTTDYQARNLNIKYRNKNENEYVHLLNGTAIAISRILIAILENYQQKDGSVLIPEVLQKYVGKDKISSSKRVAR